jgi:hypothetical protein
LEAHLCRRLCSAYQAKAATVSTAVEIKVSTATFGHRSTDNVVKPPGRRNKEAISITLEIHLAVATSADFPLHHLATLI